MRVVAVDWSGRRDDAGGTWIAVAVDGRLVELRPESRDGVVRSLCELASTGEALVAGLDFSFGLPGWFIAEHGVRGEEVWDLAAERGEQWLAACEPPFFGRKGTRRPDGELFRRTELDLRAAGLHPKSTFQIAGAGAVGTGSLRGMPHLRSLRDAGFAVWPFTSPGGGDQPCVLELYPRALTGPVVKRDPSARAASLAPLADRLDGRLLALAAASEDAFDAAVSALGMADHVAELALAPEHDPTYRAEGRIWVPSRP